MVSSRSKGVTTGFVAAELFIVSVLFWATAMVWDFFRPLVWESYSHLLFYNEFLLVGLVIITPGSREPKTLQAHEIGSNERLARRQTISECFAFFAVAVAVRDVQFPRGFFGPFVPTLTVRFGSAT